MDGWIWWGVGGGFQENVTPEVNFRESVWVRKEHLGKSMHSSCVILGKSHYRGLFCNMKLMHNIGKSVMSHGTRTGVGASSHKPRMVQADARWEKTRGTMPFSTTTRSGSDRSRQRQWGRKLGGSVGLHFMIPQGVLRSSAKGKIPSPRKNHTLNC